MSLAKQGEVRQALRRSTYCPCYLEVVLKMAAMAAMAVHDLMEKH